MSGRMTGPWLTREQVLILNQTHGYFAYADAQGDVSNAFANQAVEMHERIRAAAPELLEAGQRWIRAALDSNEGITADEKAALDAMVSAIAKATGATP